MTLVRQPSPAIHAARQSGARRAWRSVLRRSAGRANRDVTLLVLGTVVITALIVAWPDVTPLNALVVPMLLGSLMLGPRQLPWFVVFIMVALMVALAAQETVTVRTVGAVAILFLLSFIILLTSFRRSRLGVAGALGESMLVDLRDRILGQGGLPQLPEGWYAESALRSAGGTPFAGDFVVAAQPRSGDRLEVVVVDVSGKGEQAGTRALLLSGACGGLLTALPPAEFLRASNDYLLRQEWEEGFATAIHLSLDLVTGRYEIRSAGHPPAVQLTAGSGRWSLLESEGPVLGLLDGAEFPPVEGVLRHGDALLLYTDGMVETPRRDIGLGIDRLLGQAERLLRGNFDGGAARLVESLGSQNDDRALLLLHRR
jgi:Stage II sporulation protein E (SpoIIE)